MILLLWACAPETEIREECSSFYDENFGAGFVTENCRGCHAKEASDREGASHDIYFDQEADIRSHLVKVIAELEADSMPPAGGVEDAQRSAALEWLYCMEEQ